jgi:iron complex outermembrane receptor protein
MPLKANDMKKILLLLLFILPAWLGAQTIIQGTVKDVTSNEPLIGAFVTIKGLNLTTVADERGIYSIVLPSSNVAQKIILRVSHLGYKDGLTSVEILPIDDGETIFKNFELEPDPLTIKDITVTANRVEEELQDVPVAVSVFDAENMRKRTVANTEEAFEMTPNLVSDAYLPSRSTFSLRGLASDFVNLGIENSVGLYIDDVFYSRSFNFNQTLMDIERVEVLRGPQGTLFGKNTIGGVLHVISEKPKMGNSGAIELNGGNFRYLQARGKVNLMLVPNKLAVRAAGVYRSREGWLLEKNEKVRDQNGLTFYGSRLSFLFQPSHKVDVLVSGTYTKDTKAEFTIDYKVPDNGIILLPIDETQRDPFDRKVSQDEPSVYFHRNNYGIHSKIDVRLDRVHKLTSITAYNGSNSDFLRDFDATSVSATVFGKDARIGTFSQELRLSTPRENRKLHYVAGLYYLRETLEDQDTLVGKEGMANVWRIVLPKPPFPPNYPPDNYFESARNDGKINTSSYAAYLSGSYELTSRVRMNAGLRFTKEDKSVDFWQRCNCPFGILSALVAPSIAKEGATLKKDVSDTALSGNVGMDFKTTDKILLYVNFSRGFKGSGFNISLTPDTSFEKIAFIFKPEYINNYEVGMKLRYNNRFQFNAAAFVTDFRNKQEVVAAGNSIFVSNARTVQGQGLEAEFTGIWTSFFKTEVALGLLNLKYQDFPFITPFAPFTPVNLSGNRAYKSPDFTFKFAPEIYKSIGTELKLLLRFDYNFVGKTYNDIFNTESLARKASGVLNARLNISTINERFSLGLWGRNLTNVTYIQHGWSFIFGDHVSVNPPRMIGVELRANFY